MAYEIDLDVLGGVARAVVEQDLPTPERVTRAIELLAAEYPDLIDPVPGRWVASRAGGVLGKVRMVFSSNREYIVIFGTPTGTQGFSGRYKHVDIHKFLIAGKIDSYDIEADDVDVMTLHPGEHTHMAKGRVRGVTIHPGSFHIEYGRGPVIATMPFAMVDTLFVSLELESVRQSAREFKRMARWRRQRS